MFADVYQNRRVLVTGHTGFAGAWLCAWLQSLGARVSGFARQPAAAHTLGAQAGLAEHMTSLWGDVRDAQAVHHAVRAAEPEIIFHLALPEDAPDAETVAAGTVGVWHVLEAAQAAPAVRAVLCVAGDTCYAGAGVPHACREDAPCADTAYGAACACTAQLLRVCAARQAGPCMACARTGRLLGGGDWRRGSLLAEAAAAWAAESPWRMTEAAAVRPWQYVLDALSGVLWLGAALFLADAARAEAADAAGNAAERGTPDAAEGAELSVAAAAAAQATAFFDAPDAARNADAGAGMADAASNAKADAARAEVSADMADMVAAAQSGTGMAGAALERYFPWLMPAGLAGTGLHAAWDALHGTVWNCGPAAAARQRGAGLAEDICRHFSGLRVCGEARVPAAGPQALDSGKALALLGWRSVLDVEEGVRAAADWYKAWRWSGTGKQGRGLRDVSLGQIAAYTAAAEYRGAAWLR